MQRFNLIRKVFIPILCVAGLGLMSGCAHNFVRPAPEALHLGKSHADDVIKTVQGNPIRQNDVNINNEKIDLVTYLYVGSPKFYGSVIPRRQLTYSFFHDVLIGDELNSTMEEEKTQFDTTKVAQIKKGETKDQVIAILGQPAGHLLYPLIADKTGSGFAYEYAYARFAPIVSPSWSYLLIITFDENNVVENIDYKENGKEVYAQK